MKNTEFAVSVLEHINRDTVGILVNKNGDVQSFTDQSDLFNVRLQPDDLYIVRPHGEIILPTALAVRQKIARVDSGIFLHIDAHWDGETSHRYADKEIDSETAAKMLDAFLYATDEESARERFHALCAYMKDDIVTFIASMKRMIPHFAAFIRPDLSKLNEARFYNPRNIDSYISDMASPVLDLTLEDVIASNRVAIYGIDMDFCGTTREGDGDDEKTAFEERLHYLLNALNVELDRSGQDRKEGSDPIYLISIDDQWCQFWHRALRVFLNEYYAKLVEKIGCPDGR